MGDDCISREAVLEILGNYGCTNREGLLFRDIKELPSVKPKDDFEEVAEDIDMMEEDIDLACEALEEDDDCISRSDMLDAIGHGSTYTSGELQRIIKKMPSVNPKEITGEWKQGEIDWYKLGKCIEEGFRKGLSNDRNKGESKYF